MNEIEAFEFGPWSQATVHVPVADALLHDPWPVRVPAKVPVEVFRAHDFTFVLAFF